MNDKKFKPMKEVTREEALKSIRQNFDNNRKLSHDFNERMLSEINDRLNTLEDKEYKNAR